MRELKNESGFSMVSIMITLALISIIGVAAGQFFVKSQQTRKTLAAKMNYQDVNRAVMKMLQNIARNPPTSGCYTMASLTQQMAAYPFATMSTQVSQGLTATQNAGLSAAKNGVVAAAVGRCQAPKVVSDATDSQDSALYFCLRFTRDTTESSDTISGSPHAFAEIKLQMIDAHSNLPTSCDSYRSLNQGAMQAYYSVYWATPSPTGIEYSQRNSYIHVAK